jgi:hypothetical protein
VDYRPKANAVILLNMSHTLKKNAHWTNREKEGNLKLECGLYAHCRRAIIVILNWKRTRK